MFVPIKYQDTIYLNRLTITFVNLSISSLIIKVNNTLEVYSNIAVLHCYNQVAYIQFLVVLL